MSGKPVIPHHELGQPDLEALIERTGRARTADYGGLAAVTPRLAALTSATRPCS